MLVNRHGADWLIIKAFVAEEIDACRSRLEGPLGIEDTMLERGRVAAFRQLLELVEPAPRTPASEDENYG